MARPRPRGSVRREMEEADQEEDWLPVGGDELPGSSNGGAELAAGNSYADLPAGSDEAGKSLRDRLKSTDSELVNERLESLCMNNRQLAAEKVNNSQWSLDISFESIFRQRHIGL